MSKTLFDKDFTTHSICRSASRWAAWCGADDSAIKRTGRWCVEGFYINVGFFISLTIGSYTPNLCCPEHFVVLWLIDEKSFTACTHKLVGFFFGGGGGLKVALTWVFTVLVRFSDWLILNASKWLLCLLIIGLGFVKLTAAVLIFFSGNQTVWNSTSTMLGPRRSNNIMMEVLCWTSRCGCSSP